MGDIRGLENVQRRATKLISTLRNLSYPERLQSLNLPSLSYRRSRMDLIMANKILNDLVVVDKDYFFTINTNCITRTNGLKIFKKFNKSTIRRFIFSQRIINDWNSLPRDIVTAPNVLSFKTNLDKFLYNQRFSFV